MADNNRDRTQERTELIARLADNIIESVEPLIDPETDKLAIRK